MRYPLFLLLLVFIFKSQAQTLKVHNNYESARKKALRENKILVIDFYTDWCGWCKELDNVTYKDPAVIEKLNSHFVLVKLNAEKANSGYEIGLRYAVTAFPRIYYFNADNRVVHITEGFMEPKNYVGELDSVIRLNQNGFYFKGISGNASLDFPAFYRDFFPKDKSRKIPDSAAVSSYINQKTVYSEQGFLVFSALNYYMNPAPEVFSSLDSLAKLFPPGDVYDILYSKLYRMEIKTSTMSLDSIHRLIDLYGPRDEETRHWWHTIHAMYYFENRQNWIEYAQEFNRYLIKTNFQTDPDNINQNAWDIYENSTDPIALSFALQWMEHIIPTDMDYNHWDTYAALLMANNRNKEAEEWALKAIELGRSQNKNVTQTEKLLQKIRSKPE